MTSIIVDEEILYKTLIPSQRFYLDTYSIFREAEYDCTEALNLDDRYIKAYLCRATARKELGKLKESIEAYYRFWICIEVGT
ncbi:hypothetical protein OIU74_021332 [Salix koriyanagi]|uniref:Photosystem I assembly protein Ycf3 n=1 Tax=Salix koriyanagi TaxID=2511006 RepID=A0A9Q0P7X6_9ROSI|nr:hypothetical protein OIU74_021332 [Salix koriyanagi]